MNNFNRVLILEPGGRSRPGLYVDIPVPVLKVPVGGEGVPGGLPNFLKEEKRRNSMRKRRRMMRKRRRIMRRRRRIMRMRMRWGGRGGMRRICRTAWW